MRIAPFALVGGLLFAGACGDDGASAPVAQEGCVDAVDARLTIVAEDLAWSSDCISIEPDVDTVIVVDNQDVGVNHNIHLLGLPGGDPKTKLELGPVQQEIRVMAPTGEYVFVCDIHPNMKGDLIAG